MARYNGFATFSACGVYRYELVMVRSVGSSVIASAFDGFSMIQRISRSTTVSKRVGGGPMFPPTFSENWGYNGLMVGNLYAYKATVSADLMKAMRAGVDVVGPLNNERLQFMVAKVRAGRGRIMAAWGQKAKLDRVKEVTQIAGGDLWCIDTNADGSPVHPLYQPHNRAPRPWKGMP